MHLQFLCLLDELILLLLYEELLLFATASDLVCFLTQVWPPLRRARGGLSPDVGRDLLTNFSVLHYSTWEARVQVINFWSS